ncbi:prephenate dehydratase domain-containing protein [Psittacicella gerlachiana]|uniref:Bifunctional chorismate mutase/prephenate dehydratase n=1 Tax=Psittacicella gerlachiana TaxID=2028574 RepID=A0A3A1YPB3_9GAMM|nr:prephenate dehydratase domain-containing protein [Psittacicella gerlachiana]RIY37867.1 hypothetical protein CKF59_01285 [Psittacicella gerlachiana]
MTLSDKDLGQIRESINSIDEKIIELLGKRRDLSAQVAEYKALHNHPIKDLKREKELLTNLVNKSAQHSFNVNSDLLNAIYKSIINDSCNYQQEIIIRKQNLYNLSAKEELNISYLGLKGSYSYVACEQFAKHLSKKANSTGYENFNDVVNAVTSGVADFAVLPLENTSSGSINEVYDLLAKTSLEIVSDIAIDINHVYLAKELFDEKEIEVIYTHAQPYEQSIIHIRELQPNAKIVFTASTTHAMQEVAKSENKRAVAIGNASAASLYDLKVISDTIANSSNNQTRFIVLSKQEIKFSESVSYKTMLQLITNHSEGALVNSLEAFKKYKINLTKLESRPILGSPWREMFFIEFEGHINQVHVQQALTELEENCRGFKVVGSFPSFIINDEIYK